MLNFLTIFIPAILISLFFKFLWKKDITNKESFISLSVNLVVSLLLSVVFILFVHGKVGDYNIITGYVTAKQQVKVSCEHSYRCNCYQSCSGSGSSRTCTEICSTCYDHANDWDWDVKTTIGTFTIDRIDRRGSNMPPRWDVVQLKDTVHREVSFKNWLLADPTSLFLEGAHNKRYNHQNYPRVFDYYRLDRIKGDVNLVSFNKKVLNDILEERLKYSGFKNIVVYFTKEQNEDYFNSLMAQWNGGKQNDYVFVFGMGDDNTINWFKSNSYAKGMNNISNHNKLEDLAEGKQFSLDLFSKMVDTAYVNFVQVDPTQFEFKKDSIKIPFALIFILLLINLATSIGLAIYMKREKL